MRSRPTPGAVYAVADLAALAPRDPAEAARRMAAAGIQWIQLRAKPRPPEALSDADLLTLAERCRAALAGSESRLWVDDRADVAALVGAAGVHVGQADLPPSAARAAVGGDCWIGRSTHDLEQVREADADPDVDVIAFGPIFPTTGKSDPDPVVGLDRLRRARALTRKPLIAIGGIETGNLADVLAAGADSAAVLGAVCRGDVTGNSRRLLAAAEGGA